MKMYAGFSLFELMITLTIVLILAVLVTPYCLHYLEKPQQNMMAMQLLSAIELARSEAIKMGQAVILEPIDEWRGGYRLRQDQHVLYTVSLPVKDRLIWKGKVKKDFLTFEASGCVQTDDGAFYYCAEKALKPAWMIVLNIYARVRIVEPDAKGNIFNDEGKRVVC